MSISAPSQTNIDISEKDSQNELQEELIRHIESYPIKLEYPASVFSASSSPSSSNIEKDDSSSATQSNAYLKSKISPRTSQDFINFRLIDAGVQFFVNEDEDENKSSQDLNQQQTVADASKAIATFVSDLNKTGCYDSVQVILGRCSSRTISAELGSDGNPQPLPTSSMPSSPAQQIPTDLRHVDVILNEKRWYKLYIGGGIKPVGIFSSFGSSPSEFGVLPKVQFETSGGLINLTGHCDMTMLSYSVDQTSLPTLTLSHSRPLYTLFHPNSLLQDLILSMDQGSKLTATFRTEMDTIDYEHLRSSKDHHQLVGLRISNQLAQPSHQPLMDGISHVIDWSLSSRDIVPKRSMTWPYLCDASPEIVASSGPTLKHSISFESRMNGKSLDDKFNPTSGIDAYIGGEVAGPPGDVGFMKMWMGGSFHFPFVQYHGFPCALHLATNIGFLKPLLFGGTCSVGGISNVNDRFFIGGPNQLRGFLPGGIGPRSKNVSLYLYDSKLMNYLTKCHLTKRLREAV